VAASVAAFDEEFVVEHSSDSIVYIAVVAVSERAAVAAASVVAPVKTETESERFAELNIVENSHSSFAGRAEDTVAVVADTAAVFAVGIVFVVLVGVAQLTFAVESLVVAGLIEPAVLVNYAVEPVERLIVIAVAEWAFESVAIALKLDFASEY